MDNNIFEGAKFDEKFVTKNGEIAIYHYYNGTIMNQHNLILKDGGCICCKPDGHEVGYSESTHDIVSKYHEEIDKEKLDERALQKYPICSEDEECYLSWNTIRELQREAYKAGYRKAKEE